MSYHIRQRNIEEHASSKCKYNIWSKIVAHQNAKSQPHVAGACREEIEQQGLSRAHSCIEEDHKVP